MIKIRTLLPMALTALVTITGIQGKPMIASDSDFGPPFIITDGFNVPAGLGIDYTNDRAFIADTGNHSIKYADSASLLTSPIWNEFGFVADRSLPEALNGPQAVAIDTEGNAYVADTGGNEVQLYRWDAVSDTYVYDASFAQVTRNSVEGVDILFPRDIAVGFDGKVYLLDSGNHRILVADGPDDDSWGLWRENDEWGNPYGLDAAEDGSVYLADTDNHRIIRITPTGTEEPIGQYGTRNGQFRYPRDVAVSDDGRIFVADTYNHRIAVLNEDGSHYRNIGAAPLFGILQKIEVDTENRIFVIDSDYNRLVVYGRPGDKPAFDAYVRDFVGDSGLEPSPDGFILSSPDILVRHNPDVDLEQAARVGLEAYEFQQPRHSMDNYVYLAVRNRGTQEIRGVTAKFFWSNPGSSLEFPSGWNSSGFYTSYADESTNSPGNSVWVPYIEPRHIADATEMDGVTVVGPLVWRPPSPESAPTADGVFDLVVRLVHLNDTSETASGIEQVTLNNNIALRSVKVTRRPFPIGDQDTLVLRVNFPDVAGEPNEATVIERVADLSQWIEEVSYGLVTLKPLFRGPITLSRNKDEYFGPSQSILIDMASEVLNQLLASEPGVLNGSTSDPEDDIDRVIMILNDPSFTSDMARATTDRWPYDLLIASAEQFGTPKDDYVEDIDVDSAGIFVAGSTKGTLPGEPHFGRTDAFVRRYDLLGDEVWTRQFGTSEFDHVYDISVNSAGVFVAGSTNGTLPGETNFGGLGDAYVRRYDLLGDEVWTRQFGTPAYDGVTGIGVNPAGVFVAGVTYGALPGQTDFGKSDVFVRRYDLLGDVVWTRQFGTPEHDFVKDIDVDSASVFVAGRTEGALPGKTDLGDSDAFVRRYDLLGNEVWTRQFGTPNFESAMGVAVGSDGVYVAGVTRGAFLGQARFGRQDAFVQKHDFDGNMIWSRQFGSPNRDIDASVALNSLHVFVAGTTEGALPEQSYFGAKDVYVRMYDFDGNHIHTRQFGTPTSENVSSIFADDSNIFLSGSSDGSFPGLDPSGGSDGYFLTLSTMNAGEVVRHLSVSIHGPDHTVPELAHGLSHQFGLKDLYIYENVDFPIEHVADKWDNMANPFEGAHPLTWNKEFPTWVTASGGEIFYIPRPPKGSPPRLGEPPTPVHYQSTLQNDEYGAIAIGLTEGVTSFEEENHFYWVEARSPSLGNADSVVPAEGVLVYYANKLIPQGQAPVLIRDHAPATPELDDAVLGVGGSESPGGTGITIVVDSVLPDNDGYLVRVDYDPPPTDYDVFMNPGDPPWASPDIWVDNQADGYDENNARPPQDRGNQGITGEENRLYARVWNTGPADAHDVEVSFQLSEPAHTVGGQTSFTQFKTVFVDTLPSGSNATPFVTWTPLTGVNPHTCARVELRRLFSDINSANNVAQRNLDLVYSVHGSPYTSVEFQFQVTNDADFTQPIYFRADNVPEGWSWSIMPDRAVVAPGMTATGVLRLQPPDSAAECTSHQIYVTGWVSRGDTLIRLGGATVQVNLQAKTELETAAVLGLCTPEDIEQAGVQGSNCVRVNVSGCTIPPIADQEIVVRYEGPDGDPIYHTVRTDANGCFKDFNVTVEGEEWEVKTEFPGDICQGLANTVESIDVPLPTVDHPESNIPNNDRRLNLSLISKNVNGVIVSGQLVETRPGECESVMFDEILDLEVESNIALEGGEMQWSDAEFMPGLRIPQLVEPEGGEMQRLDGEIRIEGIHQLQSLAQDGAGFLRGRFIWRGRDFRAVGTVSGITGIGTHYPPVSDPGESKELIPGHRELWLEGVVMYGPFAGARLRAALALDRLDGNSLPEPGAEMEGAMEGVLEQDSLLSDEALARRIRLAQDQVAILPQGLCSDGELPCLTPVAKAGSGLLILDEIIQDQCDGENCQTYKTRSRLEAELGGIPEIEGGRPILKSGILSVDNFAQVAISGLGSGRGEHGGAFAFKATDGTIVRGEMSGIINGGTHRLPLTESLEQADIENHLEGRLTGTVENGPMKGATVEAGYAMQIDDGDERRREFVITLRGWLVPGCPIPN